MEGRDGQVFRRVGALVRVPRLTAREREVLGGVSVGRVTLVRVLKALMRKGLVEVVGVNPGRYRLTRLGVVALRLAGGELER